jgi:DNA-binding transcriptional LysR family regulator
MFVAQPTLSQQIRRVEEIVGTQLLERRREGLQLTKAGAVLQDASRSVLALVDHEVNRTRQAAGLGRPRLRVVMPPRLPDAFAVEAASALRRRRRPRTWISSGWKLPSTPGSRSSPSAGPTPLWAGSPTVQRRCPPRSMP